MIPPVQTQKSIMSIKHVHTLCSGCESEDIAVETTESPAHNKLDSVHSTTEGNDPSNTKTKEH